MYSLLYIRYQLLGLINVFYFYLDLILNIILIIENNNVLSGRKYII